MGVVLHHGRRHPSDVGVVSLLHLGKGGDGVAGGYRAPILIPSTANPTHTWVMV